MNEELQKTLAVAADLSKKASPLIGQLVADLAVIKGHLETIFPQLAAIHKKMTQGAPELLSQIDPVELEPVAQPAAKPVKAAKGVPVDNPKLDEPFPHS